MGWFPTVWLLLALTACGGGLTPLPPLTAPEPAPSGLPGGATGRLGARPASSGPLGDGITDRDLDALWARQLMVPVEGIAVSAVQNNYEARRGARLHLALDLMAPTGTPVLSADDGRIGRLGTTPVGGNIIYATDEAGQFVYYYAHLDRFRRGVSVGDRVRKGEVIGYVGSTGNADRAAPHLHFQVMRRGAGRVWWDGPVINPFPFFALPGTPRK